MGHFRTYKLSEKQIRGIANIVLHEQSTVAGWYAEASLIANLAELKFGGDPVRAVCSSWFAHGKSRYRAGTSNKRVIGIVKRVFCDGFRTLPKYVNEHDCLSDIRRAETPKGKNIKWSKSKYEPHSTLIYNRYTATYYFYCFPGGYKSGNDPFGYTSKKLRDKYGDFCYTVKEAESGLKKAEELMPILKRGSKGKAVKWLQVALGMPANGSFGEKTEAATKQFQKEHGLKVDGIVGAFTWSAIIGTL